MLIRTAENHPADDSIGRARPPASTAVRRAALALTVVGALGMPAAAQADSRATASAAAKAGASANADLASASRLTDSASSTLLARAEALQNRSRRALKLAVAKTKSLVASADTSQEVTLAARAVSRVSSALRNDAQLEAQIAIAAEGPLASTAASALVTDVRMQQAIIAASLDMAGNAAAGVQAAALKGSVEAVQRLIDEVEAAVLAASSTGVSEAVRAAAELAVAIGTDALATDSTLVAALMAETGASSEATVQRLLDDLAAAADEIATTIQNAGIDAAEVTLPGVGVTTLGALSRLGVSLTASASASGSASAETPGASGKG